MLPRDVFENNYKNSLFFLGSIIGYQGIDRINNNVGYESGNCVPCCNICNRAKLNRDKNAFIQWGLNLARNIKQLQRVAHILQF